MYDLPPGSLEAMATNPVYGTGLEYSNDLGKTWIDHSNYLVGGDVSCSRKSKARWQSNIVLDKGSTPIGLEGFNYYHTRYRLTRFMRIPRLGVVSIPWGVYRVEDMGGKNKPLTIKGYSEEVQIEDSRFLIPRNFKRQTVKDLVTRLITEVDEDAVINWYTQNKMAYVGQFFEEQDRLGILMGSSQGGRSSLSVTHSLEMYYDGHGVFTVADLPMVKKQADWELMAKGRPFLVTDEFQESRDRVYNVVVVTGITNDGTPPLGPCFAYERDALSPTYPGPDPTKYKHPGKFGIIPRFYKSPFFTQMGQLRKTADHLLGESLMVKSERRISGMANPASEPGDTISIKGMRYLLNGWSTKLEESTMTYELQDAVENPGDIEITETVA